MPLSSMRVGKKTTTCNGSFCSVFFFCCVGKLDINNTKDLYRDLVSVFDKLILPTHASCHIQYFMFYICSFKLVSRSCF